MEHFDVLVVGAGISGIAAGYYLKNRCPERSFAILEGRERLGGTWDLFRYPGIRSDSDMYTLGYSFRPWEDPKMIADGPSILRYIRETAEENGLDRKIRFRHRVQRARWSTDEARWVVDVERDGTPIRLSCNFLFLCAGYYRYEEGYTPEFPGADRFRGRIVHPQKWTDDVRYEGKKVVVIGSGATAMTLVPQLALHAAHVTMLQRSPTWVVSLPSVDPVAAALRRRLPRRAAYVLTRWKQILIGAAFYHFCRRRPERARAMLLQWVRRQVGEATDVDRHFAPDYNPWDQRVCLVPDGDLFEAIRAGRVSVVTDHIDTFTETGIRLRSGEELEADLIVTATGLNLQLLGGIGLEVDGRPVDLPRCYVYKGMMLSGVPNLAMAIGYTNASWTLKAELICGYVCRLLRHMDRTGTRYCVPQLDGPPPEEEPLLDLAAGYVLRALHRLPKQGSRVPWRLYQNYLFDLVALRYGKVDDGVMQFGSPAAAEGKEALGALAAG